MKELIQELGLNNIYALIISILILLIVLVFIFWKIKKSGLRPFLIHLIVQAEESFKQGQNSEKFQYVYDRIYAKLPLILQLVVTKETIDRFIQSVFDSVKEALDYVPDELLPVENVITDDTHEDLIDGKPIEPITSEDIDTLIENEDKESIDYDSDENTTD